MTPSSSLGCAASQRFPAFSQNGRFGIIAMLENVVMIVSNIQNKQKGRYEGRYEMKHLRAFLLLLCLLSTLATGATAYTPTITDSGGIAQYCPGCQRLRTYHRMAYDLFTHAGVRGHVRQAMHRESCKSCGYPMQQHPAGSPGFDEHDYGENGRNPVCLLCGYANPKLL